jgi:hypothetical protein
VPIAGKGQGGVTGGRQKGSREPYENTPDWWPGWYGETIVIVASGPSAGEENLVDLEGRCRIIAVNNSWQLVPFAEILYGCDWDWWHRYNGVPNFKGMKVSIDKAACKKYPDIKRMYVKKQDDKLELIKPGHTGWAGNSGFHAFNLAVQQLPKKIILVGYDMTIRHGLHWHGSHQKGMNNPREANIKRWIRAMDATAEIVAMMGIRVINASKVSMLSNFEKMPLSEAMKC